MWGRRDDRAGTISWRERVLRDAGMAPELARGIAADERYDLHAIIGLLERGCPPSLALDITAPLEHRRTP